MKRSECPVGVSAGSCYCINTRAGEGTAANANSYSFTVAPCLAALLTVGLNYLEIDAG